MTKRTFFIALVVVALPLGLLGCTNNDVDDSDNSDTIIRIESVACVEPDTVAVTVGGISRGGAAGSPLNDVILESYQITSGGVSLARVSITVLVPANGTGSFDASVSGVGTRATILVEGRDTLGNPASAETDFGIGDVCTAVDPG